MTHRSRFAGSRQVGDVFSFVAPGTSSRIVVPVIGVPWQAFLLTYCKHILSFFGCVILLGQ